MKPVIIGVALVAVAGLGACSRASSPAGVVEEFARKMDTGDCNGLQDYLSAQSKAVAGQKLEQACRAGNEMRKGTPDANKHIKSMNVVESKEEGDRATVRLSAEYTDGSKDGGNEPITLVREDGRWKIDLLAGMSRAGGGGMAPGMGGEAPSAAPAAPAPTAPTATPPATTTETTTTNTTSTSESDESGNSH